MPDINTQNFSNELQLIQKVSLENGWEQWLLKSKNPLKINPASDLIIDNFSLPVLWQLDDYQFFCLKSADYDFKQRKQWQNFSIANIKIAKNEINKLADNCLLICPGNSLFYAIHQIQQWRSTNQTPNNLIVIAETNPNPAFKLQPSIIYSSLVPPEATASIPLLDDWGVLCRFVNKDWQPGCFQGDINKFAEIIKINLTNKNFCETFY